MRIQIALFSTMVLLLFSKITFAQLYYPGGESCETAVPIIAGEGYSTLPGSCGPDEWYSFVAPTDGVLFVLNGGENEVDKRISSGVCEALTLEVEASWADTSTAGVILDAGDTVFIQINDSWDCIGQFDVVFDSTLLDLKGYVYLDMNNNGIKDLDEVGKNMNLIISDPLGIVSSTSISGQYYASVEDLEDGTYQIYPVLEDYWGISSDSLVYNINVDSTYEQHDSLNFGLYPITFVHDLSVGLIGSAPRCNDTIIYSVDIYNTGTLVSSGMVHLALDDSLYYVSADMAPDSIVGQDIYWSYTDLFYYDHLQIAVQLGTPDGLEDTVVSSLEVMVDSAGIILFEESEIIEQVITCAYDPNDKTPTPMGIGELGYISPSTESIEYLVRFQNTGTDTAFKVVIKDQLDVNLDWHSLQVLAYSHEMRLEMSLGGEVSFIFENIMLPDSNTNQLGSNGYVKYRIDLMPSLPLETSIFNTAHIYFDLNPAVLTNTVVNTLHLDESGIYEVKENRGLIVYPNPTNGDITVYFDEVLTNHSIQIVNLLGNNVYSNDEVNGNQLEIHPGPLAQGLYLLILSNNITHDTISTTKIVVK